MKQRYKKVFIGIFAVAIAASGSLAVFTADSRAYPKGSSKGSGSIEGVVSTDIFNIVLPAVPEKVVDKNAPIATIYDFILDPQKLLTNGGFADEKYPGKTFEPDASLFFENTVGTPSYDYSHTSDPLTIQNKSTMDVDVRLNATLAGMSNITLTNDETFTDDKNASVYLALTTTNNNKVSPIDKYGAFIRSTLAGRPNAYEYAYDAVSGKYKYQLKSDDVLSAANITFADFTFQLTGTCNPSNDWARLPEPITPKLTATWTVAPRPDNVVPSIGKTSFAMCKGQPNIVDIDLGSGDLAASDISSVAYKDPSGATVLLDASSYTFSDETLTFNSSYIDELIDNGIKSREHTITFNDKAATKSIVRLTVNDIAPSIEVTSYPMTLDQPIVVEIDMGSGALKATDISSITFETSTGSLATLATEYYSLENGKLTFDASIINRMFSNAVTERDYIITLNDRAATKLTVTLSASGDFPSIQTVSYNVSRNTPVSIDVDLGSGDLAATGIETISYTTKSGTLMILSTDLYTLTTDNKLVIDAKHITDFIDHGNVSRVYKIKFNNPAKTKIEVTLTANESAPSISQDSYTMNNGQPVLIDIDMGSGSLCATNIKSITFKNKAGVVTTLGTDMYSFAGGTLRIFSTMINSMFSNGVVSREYSILLNDTNATQLTVTLTANGKLPSIPNDSYTMYRNQPVSIGIDLGSGEIGANAIASLTFVNKNGDTIIVPADSYTFGGTNLTLDATHITACINNGNTSRQYTVTFNNIAKTKAKFILTADEKAPSIAQQTYTMENNKPVIVDIDMGSGQLGATAINKITFNNKAGTLMTLGTDMYSFTGGQLRFFSKTISTMFTNGVATREYTIYLNDKNATKLTITLNANGRLPSIPAASYTMYKGQSSSVNIDLGTGEIGATGINSITFVTLSGSLATLPADKYRLSNNTLVIDSTHITSCINNGNLSRTYTVTFNNLAKTQAKFTLTAANTAPSVSSSSYKMIKGQPVLVSMDLGSGNLMATGIKSVTFINKAGITSTLGTDMYIYADGIFKIRAAHVQNMFNNGVTARQFTVVLNNKASTRLTFTVTR